MPHSARNHTVSWGTPSVAQPELATKTWDRLWPIAMTVQHDVESVCAPIIAQLQPHVQRATSWTDAQLGSLQPWQIVLLAVGSTWLALTLWRRLADIVTDIRDVGE